MYACVVRWRHYTTTVIIVLRLLLIICLTSRVLFVHTLTLTGRHTAKTKSSTISKTTRTRIIPPRCRRLPAKSEKKRRGSHGYGWKDTDFVSNYLARRATQGARHTQSGGHHGVHDIGRQGYPRVYPTGAVCAARGTLDSVSAQDRGKKSERTTSNANENHQTPNNTAAVHREHRRYSYDVHTLTEI